jgi:hypothetical protein
MLASRVFLAPSSSNRRRAQLPAPHLQPAPFSARRSQADRAVPSPSPMLLPGPAVEEGGGLHGAGGWSLLSSDGVDGSSASDSFPLSSPTNDGDDAGIGDGGDEAKAVELDGGDSKGTILTGGSVERGSSLHAPRADTRATLRDAEEEREYRALRAGRATAVFACSLAEPLERLQWSRESVFPNARSDEGALGDSLSWRLLWLSFETLLTGRFMHERLNCNSLL